MAPPIILNGSDGIDQNTTGGTKIPVGTTAERPPNPGLGEMRVNTDLGGVLEYYDGSEWFTFAGFQAFNSPFGATGGDFITDIISDGKLYRIHAYTEVGTSSFDVSTGSGVADVLVVAGGGGGGDLGGGGGGAGGVIFTPDFNITTGSYTVVVGDGGRGQFHHDQQVVLPPGEDSVFGSITASGGGPGGSYSVSYSLDGGSGGGGNYNTTRTGGAGIAGQGNSGGDNTNTGGMRAGGGGGGAGAPGTNGDGNGIGGDGGIGVNFIDYFGTSFGDYGWFGGGGGGGYRRDQALSTRRSFGGRGGGGRGCGRAWIHPNENTKPNIRDLQQPGNGDSNSVTSGMRNTGGGGGGGGYRGSSVGTGYLCGGHGGTGIVLVRYQIG